MTTFEISVLLHLVVDWVLQNDWIARNKSDLWHPAGWVHGAMHAIAMSLIFPLPVAAIIGLTHTLIDTRVPARLWARIYRAGGTGAYQVPVAIWRDQVFHLCVLAVAAIVTVTA